MKTLDIMVLGATGFTGKFVVKILAEMSKQNDLVSWGVCGRSTQKIQDFLMTLEYTGFSTSKIPIVECDIKNVDTIKHASQISRILINCTGPNTLLSAPVVNSCIETGTHYVDISAELFHVFNLYRNFHKKAEDANVLVIPTCGFSSIPVEVGQIHLERHFKGTLNTVECYAELNIPKRAYFPGRCLIHFGTWESLVHVLEDFKKHLQLKRDIFPEPVEPVPEEMKRSFFHRHKGKFWFPYPGTENEVSEMSQRYLYERKQKKPFHFKAYTTVPLLIHFLIVPVFFLYYYLCYFKCFSKLLKTYPRLFTLVIISHDGPTKSMRNQTKFSFTLNGKGRAHGADDLKSKDLKTLTVKVSCSDPGYHTTAASIVSAALTILSESDKMPKGGVLMPGAAFHDTAIVDKLINHGVTYEILE